MFHKENNTLDLLEQFSQNTQKTNHAEDDKNKIMFRELGQFISKTDKRGSKSSFGISTLIWYAIIAGILFFAFREIFFLNQINNFSDVISTINKVIVEGTNTVTETITEIQKAANKASQNASNQKEER
ncbi:hypothetical protein [Sulfurospirillum oryzae]|uniref:hypothetical protein n=1 Tax=Sulfurospirillum oryzae TaxID=2976535 RepID=UPI0021E9A93D|nr:hypothetical protein [Sulfurospirillum oryzae]